MSCICAVCLKFVKKNHRKRTCVLCNRYVHKCCSKLSVKEYRSKENVYWHCSVCNDNLHLPFHHIIDDKQYYLELYRSFEDQSIFNDLMKPTFENLKFDPLDEKNIYVSNNECNSDTNYVCNDDLKEMSKTMSKKFQYAQCKYS